MVKIVSQISFVEGHNMGLREHDMDKDGISGAVGCMDGLVVWVGGRFDLHDPDCDLV